MIKIASLLLNLMLLASPAAGKIGKPGGARRLGSSTLIDFEEFTVGQSVSDLGNGVFVQATKRLIGGGIVNGTAMIFDSASFSTADVDLGTPNDSFGGNGTGVGGVKGQPFENPTAKGKILIIAERPKGVPDDNKWGGTLLFTLSAPRFVGSIGILDSEEKVTILVTTKGGGTATFSHQSLGDNSYRSVPINKGDVTSILIDFGGSGAVSEIVFQPTTFCTTTPAINLTAFVAGDLVTEFDNGVTVSAKKWPNKKKLVLVDAKAMIFDSANPTGGDADLGTPNADFGGPGLGKAGKKSKRTKNAVAKGNLLIISEDDDSTDPDDNEYGGILTIDFPTPVKLDSIGILDNEESVRVDIYTTGSAIMSVDDKDGGNNGFELLALGAFPLITRVVITFRGSGAITEINECV